MRSFKAPLFCVWLHVVTRGYWLFFVWCNGVTALFYKGLRGVCFKVTLKSLILVCLAIILFYIILLIILYINNNIIKYINI